MYLCLTQCAKTRDELTVSRLTASRLGRRRGHSPHVLRQPEANVVPYQVFLEAPDKVFLSPVGQILSLISADTLEAIRVRAAAARFYKLLSQ